VERETDSPYRKGRLIRKERLRRGDSTTEGETHLRKGRLNYGGKERLI
jgi:hypothetical protein